jgi:hypothetical protein
VVRLERPNDLAIDKDVVVVAVTPEAADFVLASQQWIQPRTPSFSNFCM